MWSIYDTLILVTGVITAAIAVLPVAGIESKTRVLAGLIGGGLVLLALLLGSLSSFTYPSLVWAGPLIALLAAGVIVSQARKRNLPDVGQLQFDESANSATDGEATGGQYAREPEAAPQAEPVPAAPDAPVADPRIELWSAVHDEATTATRLAEIAELHPEFGAAIHEHPNCYPELRAWIEEYTSPPG